MAALKYRDEHNKVGFLEKPKGSADYHQVLDFLRGSHIRYAITHDPIIYDSLVKQFWFTASLRASEEGPPAILATIDRTPYTITESLVRSQLQLDDDGGVEDLPIADIYLGESLGEAAPFDPQTVPKTITEPDHSHDHESTLPRPTTTTSSAPVNGQGPSSDPNIASSSRPHESTQAPPEGTTSGGAKDLDKLTALSSLVSTLVQKVNTQESEFKAHKLLFKEVVGKLVKKVKLLEDKLKGRKRKFVMTDSDKEEDAEQDVDLLIKLAKGQLHATLQIHVTVWVLFLKFPPSFLYSFDDLLLVSDVPADATTGPSADPSNKGKSPLLEEDPPVKERTFRQREEDRLEEEDFRYTKFQDKRNKPMTYAQQKTYMRTLVKNQSSTIYTTGWTMKHVKSFSDDQLKTECEQLVQRRSKPTKAPKYLDPDESQRSSAEVPPTTTQQPSEFSSQPTIPSAEPRTHSYGTRRKSLSARKKSFTELDLTADDRSFIKVLSDDSYDSNDDDDPPIFWPAFAAWEWYLLY
ncbi:hypothetical protein Tco_1377879 [Tanacetum coccineum]